MLPSATAAGMGTRTRTLFYRNRRRARITVVVLGAILIAAVCFIAWSLLDPAGLERLVEESWNERLVVALPMALLLTPVLLALVIFEGRRAADDRPLLVLDERALLYRDWRCGPVPWRDVTALELIDVEEGGGRGVTRTEWYLEVRLADPEQYLRAAHGGGEFSDGYERRYFRIPLKDIRAGREELFRAVERHLKAWREREVRLEPSLVGLGRSPADT